MSIIREPESDEVTKKIIVRSIATQESSVVPRESFKHFEQCQWVIICLNCSVTPVKPPVRNWWIAVPPKALNQSKHSSVGRKRTKITNSRTVRPFEMRAINVPNERCPSDPPWPSRKLSNRVGNQCPHVQPNC